MHPWASLGWDSWHLPFYCFEDKTPVQTAAPARPLRGPVLAGGGKPRPDTGEQVRPSPAVRPTQRLCLLLQRGPASVLWSRSIRSGEEANLNLPSGRKQIHAVTGVQRPPMGRD